MKKHHNFVTFHKYFYLIIFFFLQIWYEIGWYKYPMITTTSNLKKKMNDKKNGLLLFVQVIKLKCSPR